MKVHRNLNISLSDVGFSSFPFPLPFPKCLCIAPNTFRLLSAKNNTVKLNDRSYNFVRKFETKHQCKWSVLSELNVLSRTHSRLVLGKLCRQSLTASSEPSWKRALAKLSWHEQTVLLKVQPSKVRTRTRAQMLHAALQISVILKFKTPVVARDHYSRGQTM